MRVGANPDHEKIGQIFGQEVLEFECNYCQAVFLIIKKSISQETIDQLLFTSKGNLS